MKTIKINQLTGLEILSNDAQMNIMGGKKGWFKKLFKRKPSTTPSSDDHGNHTGDHDKNDDHGHHGSGHH